MEISLLNTSISKEPTIFWTGLETSESGSEKSELIRSLNIRNAEALEARVRKELEEQGILDPNEDDSNNGEAAKDNDEVYEELLRCQVSLSFYQARDICLRSIKFFEGLSKI